MRALIPLYVSCIYNLCKSSVTSFSFSYLTNPAKLGCKNWPNDHYVSGEIRRMLFWLVVVKELNSKWALTLKQYRLLLYHQAIKQCITCEQNRFICTGPLTQEQCDIECCYITAIYHWAIRHADCSVMYCCW